MDAAAKKNLNSLVVGAFAFWLVFLFLQSGNWLDEAEHCNAAWLMGSQHLRPYTDFFQHHSPLLWDLLAVFYRLGGKGAEVLFFGRLLVVCFGVMVVWSLRAMTKQVSGFATPLIPFALVFFLFGTFAVAYSSTFVIRPETPALGLGAVALWAVGRGKYAWGGLVWGVAIYASPRLALASPLWLGLLLPTSRDRLVKALGTGIAGAVVGFTGYSLLLGHTFADYAFVLSFSQAFQKVGNINGFFAMKMGSSPPLFGPVLLAALLFRWLYAYADGDNRRRICLHASWLGVLVALALLLSWPHAYPQNFMPAYFYATFALVDILNRQTWSMAEPAQRSVPFYAVWFMLAMALALFSDLRAKAGVINSYRIRAEMLELLMPGETVMLPYMIHPIAVGNASFYGGYQDDGVNRTCRAVELSRYKASLPPCRFLEDLVAHSPALIEATTLPYAVEPEAQGAVKSVMEQKYALKFTLREPKGYAILMHVNRSGLTPR